MWKLNDCPHLWGMYSRWLVQWLNFSPLGLPLQVFLGPRSQTLTIAPSVISSASCQRTDRNIVRYFWREEDQHLDQYLAFELCEYLYNRRRQKDTVCSHGGQREPLTMWRFWIFSIPNIQAIKQTPKCSFPLSPNLCLLLLLVHQRLVGVSLVVGHRESIRCDKNQSELPQQKMRYHDKDPFLLLGNDDAADVWSLSSNVIGLRNLAGEDRKARLFEQFHVQFHVHAQGGHTKY